MAIWTTPSPMDATTPPPAPPAPPDPGSFPPGIPPPPVGGSYSYSYPTYVNDPRIGNGDLPVGISGTGNRAFTRTVQPNELASYQLNQINDPNSAYIQQARQQAMAAANARGLGNSAYAIGNAQGAAIRAALPIAQANANTYGQTASENMKALNDARIAAAQLAAAHAGAGASRAAAEAHDQMMLQMQREQLAYQGEQAALQRSYGQNTDFVQHGYGLDNAAMQQMYGLQNMWYQHQLGLDSMYQQGALNDYYGGRQDARNTYNNILQGGFGQLFSNPDMWNDPQGALGMASMFGNYAGNMINQFNGGPPQGMNWGGGYGYQQPIPPQQPPTYP